MTDETELSLLAMRERDPQAFASEIDAIRATLLDYLDYHSLRQASREVGMSPSGLSKFIDGGDPQVPTIRKLRTWMATQPARRPVKGAPGPAPTGG